MRIIKFRGKSIDEGKWVYGDLLQFYLNGEPVKTNFSILPFEVEKIDKHTYENQPVSICYDTIGQFTGMYDCNGKEIYEGDILRTSISKNGIGFVSWNIENASFVVQMKNSAQWYNLWSGYEVIGNIHDNPELLKGDIG